MRFVSAIHGLFSYPKDLYIIFSGYMEIRFALPVWNLILKHSMDQSSNISIAIRRAIFFHLYVFQSASKGCDIILKFFRWIKSVSSIYAVYDSIFIKDATLKTLDVKIQFIFLH